MNPLRFMRKAAKWAGVAASLLMLATWTCSGWFCVRRYERSDVIWQVDRGCLEIWGSARGSSPPTATSWWSYQHSCQMQWAPSYVTLGGSMSVTSRPWWRVPIWMLIVPVAAFTAGAWWLDGSLRRSRALRGNLCIRCEYHRAGLAPDAACPECGAHPPRPRP